ncbi:cell envelope integrity EipB family protein [Methylopila sp. M107]|uniref:cell envelope integrity EipB family protein n=1 Tax=Methylopila sp. M107 TaxID=1101190 RepID=UPI0003829F13|nr:cell envelope integrity EipB family protein [Methylopila sp. M107]
MQTTTFSLRVAPVALALAAATVPAAANVRLAPHRAVYELALSENRGGSGVDQVRGRIVYEFKGDACDGYALTFRQVTEIASGEGQSNRSDLRSETWEDGAGKSFRFSAKNFLNDELNRDTDGKAEKGAEAVKVLLKKPKAGESAFEAGTLFPTEHLVKIIESAQRSDTLLAAPVYDGSEAGDKTYDTLTVIGKKADTPPPSLEEPAKKPELEKQDYWPVAVSYFERGKKLTGEQTPDYQMSFDLYANGVSRDLRINYGSFVLTGALKELEFLKPGKCER